jgi:hypothetical protein
MIGESLRSQPWLPLCSALGSVATPKCLRGRCQFVIKKGGIFQVMERPNLDCLLGSLAGLPENSPVQDRSAAPLQPYSTLLHNPDNSATPHHPASQVPYAIQTPTAAAAAGALVQEGVALASVNGQNAANGVPHHTSFKSRASAQSSVSAPATATGQEARSISGSEGKTSAGESSGTLATKCLLSARLFGRAVFVTFPAIRRTA